MIPARRPRRPGPRRPETHLTLVPDLPVEFRRRQPTYEAATILEAAAAAVRSSGLTAACSIMGVAPPADPRCGTCIYCRVHTAAADTYPDGVDADAVVLAHQAAEEHGLHLGPTDTDPVAAVVAAAYDLFDITLPPDVTIARTP